MGFRIGSPVLIGLLGLLSMLVTLASARAELQTVRVTDTVYALVGETTQRSIKNLANNATFGVILTDAGVVLVDPGGTRRGAKQIHAAIKAITDKAVAVVINTGGQDHRWLGNGYWKEQGARIIASEAAVQDQHKRFSQQFTQLSTLLGPLVGGTEPVYADETFADAMTLTIGGRDIRIVHPGPAHTPGDSFVWLADEKVVFTGDIVYVDRLLGIMDYSNSKQWIESFKVMAALSPRHVVPGHGKPTTLARAEAETLNYLVHLRKQIRDHIDSGGDIMDSVDVDQTPFVAFEVFDQLARRNAQQVFQEMEWE